LKSIRVHQPGGPEALVLGQTSVPVPGDGEALIRLEYAGVNFIDVYYRTGLYPAPLPFTPGVEGAGIVEQVGASVSGLTPGTRVGYQGPLGAYAEYVSVPVDRVVPLPERVDTRAAAGILLQGMTAHYLATSTFPLRPGHTCVVLAAAGGVGQHLCRIARRRGARVIACVSTEQKAALARRAGADDVIFYDRQDLAAEVRRLTSGTGADVVYDSVGQATFEKSLEALRPLGMLVLYGQSSGPVPPFSPQVLAARGSLFLTRPILGHYTLTGEQLQSRAREVLEWLGQGDLELQIGLELPLEEAAEAHRRLQGRHTSGKVLLRI